MRVRATRVALAWMLAGAAPSVAVTVLSQAKPSPQPWQPPPHVLSGDEIGFRVEGYRNGRPTGRLVVKIDGAWVDVERAMVVRPLGSR